MGPGLLIALLLNTQIRARGFFRALFSLPVVTALVIAAIIWKWLSSGDFVHLPEDYDAARVDRTVGWQRLKDNTIPLLNSTTLFLAVVSVLGALQVFTEIFIITNGGPLRRTTTVVSHMSQTAFRNFDMRYPSAMACGMFARMFVFTLVQPHVMRGEVAYGCHRVPSLPGCLVVLIGS